MNKAMFSQKNADVLLPSVTPIAARVQSAPNLASLAPNRTLAVVMPPGHDLAWTQAQFAALQAFQHWRSMLQQILAEPGSASGGVNTAFAVSVMGHANQTADRLRAYNRPNEAATLASLIQAVVDDRNNPIPYYPDAVVQKRAALWYSKPALWLSPGTRVRLVDNLVYRISFPPPFWVPFASTLHSVPLRKVTHQNRTDYFPADALAYR